MKLIAGVDEAGRGPLAGPVVAAAVILFKNHNITGLKDSKKLSKKNREELYPVIFENAISIGIGRVDEKIIDKINIREATFKAMQMALGKLNPKPDKALIDGEALKNQIIPNIGIVGGDDIEDCIKAASIIAKVTRDKIMNEYSIVFPEYGFENHSGYGTKYHIEALDKYKSTPIHRRTFKPVKKRMPTFTWILENNKLDWLGEKLAALYIKNKGIEIIGLNIDCQPAQNINIHGKDRNINVFINIITEIIPKVISVDEIFLKNQSKIISKSFSAIQNNNLTIYNPYRFDFIVISFSKKQQPKFQYLKDIKDI